MSFTNPVKVPVKVYLSTDKDAPRLDRTPNCVQTIFKACLVTGYGDKTPAGWSLPFEDTTKGVKVLRPEVSSEIDFYLKLTADTGKEVKAEVYQNMTTIDDGEKKLECNTPFKYGYGKNSGRWILIASSRSVWFLFEQYYSSEDPNKSGGYFFCGDTAKNPVGSRAVLLKHTGGSWSDGSGFDIFVTNNAGEASHKLLDTQGQVTTPTIESLFDSKTPKSDTLLLAPVYAVANKQYYPIPAIYACSNGTTKNNFDRYVDKIVFGLSSYQTMTNFYFDEQTWVY